MLVPILAAAAVFHGVPVPAAETPWLVTLTTRGPFCGGALIAPDRVLTAAHCVQGSGPGDFHVRLNGKRLAWRGAYFPTGYSLIASPVDPLDESASATINDVAVILLERPVTGVAPLPIAATAPADGEATLTVGHGMTGPRTDVSAAAFGAAQQVLSADACHLLYGSELLHPALHLCTKDATAQGAQACGGDSGSPVLVRRDGVWQSVGVVTWGGETQGRLCGEGPADVAERALAHRPLITGAPPRALAPYSERRVRVRRSGKVRRCVVGAWHPSSADFTIRWFRRGGQRKFFLPGEGRTRTVRSGRIACTVIARTAGGWSQEDSYNAL